MEIPDLWGQAEDDLLSCNDNTITGKIHLIIRIVFTA